MQNVATAYLESQTLTASPERLHLMVVDAAIRFARKGEVALAGNDLEAAYFALDRSRTCVGELIGGINPDPNPELAERLKALFIYVHSCLTRADVERDPRLAGDALRILEAHRRTWLELMESLVPEQSNGEDPQRGSAGERSWTT